MNKVVVVGAGLVGRRAASRLAEMSDAANPFSVVLVAQQRAPEPIEGVETAVGWPHSHGDGADVVIIATESRRQLSIARSLLRRGVHVISTADHLPTIQRLWSLDDLARRNDATFVVGAAYSPGVSTVLAAALAARFDEVTSIHTAQFGTGGPACAREHHRSMGASGQEVNRGLLRLTRGGSGRELVWFPEPVGAADCYRAGLADPFLLHQLFPAVGRIESRQAATRRDRLTAGLPMLRPPHAEGLLGAVWAEVRGLIDGRVEHQAVAATGPQATGAAALVSGLCMGLMNEGGRSGVHTAASFDNLVLLLEHIANDMGLWAYDGNAVQTNSGSNRHQPVARKWQILR